MSSKQANSFKGYSNIRHNTSRYFIKCPECLKHQKNPQRVKTHKNLSSLDSHYSTEHKNEYWVKEARIELRKLAGALR
jgi:hypothetical protein